MLEKTTAIAQKRGPAWNGGTTVAAAPLEEDALEPVVEPPVWLAAGPVPACWVPLLPCPAFCEPPERPGPGPAFGAVMNFWAAGGMAGRSEPWNGLVFHCGL